MQPVVTTIPESTVCQDILFLRVFPFVPQFTSCCDHWVVPNCELLLRPGALELVLFPCVHGGRTGGAFCAMLICVALFSSVSACGRIVQSHGTSEQSIPVSLASIGSVFWGRPCCNWLMGHCWAHVQDMKAHFQNYVNEVYWMCLMYYIIFSSNQF